MLMHRAMLLASITLGGVGCAEEERAKLVGGNRPVEVGIPANFDEDRSYPLILVLHGYGATGFVQQAYFGAKAIQDRGDAFVLAPDGLVDSNGRQFWNADGFCCDFDDQNPDDVAYLGNVVDDVIADWPIDKQAVFAMGHSNGGFMAYRLACERADTFAAILSLAGNAVQLPCMPERPISVLHVHGDADDIVPFTGAESSVDKWTGLNGCSADRTEGPMLDLDNAVPGVDTRTSSTAGCPAEGAVDLWRIEGGSHLPSFTTAWEPAFWQWLQDHRRQ